jgi:hypothetical protein
MGLYVGASGMAKSSLPLFCAGRLATIVSAFSYTTAYKHSWASTSIRRRLSWRPGTNKLHFKYKKSSWSAISVR